LSLHKLKAFTNFSVAVEYCDCLYLA